LAKKQAEKDEKFRKNAFREGKGLFPAKAKVYKKGKAKIEEVKEESMQLQSENQQKKGQKQSKFI